MMHAYGCIIPAAGLSSRMHAFKPLLKLNDGITMIEHTIKSVLTCGIDICVVVLGYRGAEIESILQHYSNGNVIFVYNPDYQNTDMLHSIQIGLKSLAPYDKKGSFVVPADMPTIISNTFCLVAEHFITTSSLITFPTYEGRMKHPPLISSSCFDHIIQFQETGGLRRALDAFQAQTSYLEVSDYGCCMDADTKQDFDKILRYLPS